MGMKNILVTASILGLLFYFRKYWVIDNLQEKTYAFILDGYEDTINVGGSIHISTSYIKAYSLEEAKNELRKNTSKGISDMIIANTFSDCFSKVETKYLPKTVFAVTIDGTEKTPN